MGTHKKIPATDVITDLDSKSVERATSNVNELTLITESVTDAQLAFAQRVGAWIGRRDTASALQKLVTVTEILELQQLKESKVYRGMRLSMDGKVVTVTTFDQFCTDVVGRSREQVDEDIRNLKAFGAAALESFQRLGMGYRQMRELRQIPGDQRTELIEAAKSDDIAAVVDLAEDLIDRHSRERAKLEKRIADQAGTLEARQRLLSDKDVEINSLKEFKPSADSIARTAEQARELDELNTASTAAQLAILRLATVADTVMGDDLTTENPLSGHARSCLEYVARIFANLANSHGIELKMDELMGPPPWLDMASIDAAVKAEADKAATKKKAGSKVVGHIGQTDGSDGNAKH